MVSGLIVIVAAGLGGLAAGYLLWRAAHLSGLWNLFSGLVLVVLVFVVAILIALVMVRSRNLF